MKSDLIVQSLLFPTVQMLSIAQIYRIGTMFWDDKYGTHGLSPEVRTLLILFIDMRVSTISSRKLFNYMIQTQTKSVVNGVTRQ